MSATARIFAWLWALCCAAAGSAAPSPGGPQATWRGGEAAAHGPVEFDASWFLRASRPPGVVGPTYTNDESDRYGGNGSAGSAEPEIECGNEAPEVEVDIEYSYDLRGNRLTKDVAGGTDEDAEYEFDLEDRLTTEVRGGTSIGYEYNLRGDLVEKTAGSVTTTYVTDYARRMVHASSDGATEDFSWSYTYAPTGDRLAKTNDDDAAENEWYLPSGGDTLCDYRLPASGPEEHTGTYLSPGIDGRLVRVDGEGDATYTFACALGTPHQVTDDTGAVVRRTLNDAWGNAIPLGTTPPGTTGPGDRYGFTGRENDAESGLMHYRARSYDPVIGRFTSRDPVWHSNLYNYCGNDPVNLIDPDGREVRIPQRHLDNEGYKRAFIQFAREQYGEQVTIDSNGVIALGGYVGKTRNQPQLADSNVLSKLYDWATDDEVSKTLDDVFDAVDKLDGGNSSQLFFDERKLSGDLPGEMGSYLNSYSQGDARDLIYDADIYAVGDDEFNRGNWAFGTACYAGATLDNFAKVFFLSGVVKSGWRIALRATAASERGSKTARATTTFYRAVSVEELAQLTSSGRFATGKGAIEGGKWLAENADDAFAWGRVLYKSDNFKVVRFEVPNDVADFFMRIKRLDGIGPARFGPLDQLNESASNVVEVMPK